VIENGNKDQQQAFLLSYRNYGAPKEVFEIFKDRWSYYLLLDDVTDNDDIYAHQTSASKQLQYVEGGGREEEEEGEGMEQRGNGREEEGEGGSGVIICWQQEGRRIEGEAVPTKTGKFLFCRYGWISTPGTGKK
jgi:hypothetical protein